MLYKPLKQQKLKQMQYYNHEMYALSRLNMSVDKLKCVTPRVWIPEADCEGDTI